MQYVFIIFASPNNYNNTTNTNTNPPLIESALKNRLFIWLIVITDFYPTRLHNFNFLHSSGVLTCCINHSMGLIFSSTSSGSASKPSTPVFVKVNNYIAVE